MGDDRQTRHYALPQGERPVMVLRWEDYSASTPGSSPVATADVPVSIGEYFSRLSGFVRTHGVASELVDARTKSTNHPYLLGIINRSLRAGDGELEVLAVEAQEIMDSVIPGLNPAQGSLF